MKKPGISDSAIFTDSGCLSPEGLDLFARQLLDGNNLTRVEDHIRACPLCTDAAEGLKAFYLDRSFTIREPGSFKGDKEQSIADITVSLNNRIEKSVLEKKQTAASNERLFLLPEYWLGIAAGVLLLFGIYMVSVSPLHIPRLSEKDAFPFPDPAIQTSGDTLTISAPPGTQLALNFQSYPGTYTDTAKGIVIFPQSGTAPLLVEPAADIPLEEQDLRADSLKGSSLKRPVAGRSKPESERHGQVSYSNSDLYCIEQIPQFPGGERALATFIAGNQSIPANSPGKGTVYVSFLVNTDGTLSEIKVVKGLDEDFNKEAVRLISRMPPWLPARQNSKPVKAIVNLPVHLGSGQD
jgi:TonB family protein